MSNDSLTVVVPRGTKVNIKEVDSLRSEDARAADDRHALIVGGDNLKIAIKKVSANSAPGAQAAFMTMCG